MLLPDTGEYWPGFGHVFFVDKPSTENGDAAAPEWLTARFEPSDMDGETQRVALGKEVTLEPGETVRALLEVSITEMGHVRMLNDGQAQLEDVLVLRVVDGRDHFIPVRATWSATCIGRSIEELIRSQTAVLGHLPGP